MKISSYLVLLFAVLINFTGQAVLASSSRLCSDFFLDPQRKENLDLETLLLTYKPLETSLFSLKKKHRLSENKKQLRIIAEKFVKKLKEDPRTWYFDENADDKQEFNRSFVASNETDWHRMEEDYSHSDLILGYGTTMAWNHAVRKKSRAIVIADIALPPLIVHRFLFEPLIKASNSRADFFHLLSGTNKDLVDFTVNDFKTHHYDFSDQKEFRQHIFLVLFNLRRLSKDPKVSALELEFITLYYSQLIFGDRSDRYGMDLFTEGVVTSGIFQIVGYLIDSLPQNPKWADELLELNKFYSAFSSESSFRYLKKIVSNQQIFYSRGSAFDKELNNTISNLAKVNNMKTVTINLSNIIDFIDSSSEFTINQQRYFGDLVNWYSSSEAPVIIFQTRGTRGSHFYERHVLDENSKLDYLAENTGRWKDIEVRDFFEEILGVELDMNNMNFDIQSNEN